MNVAARLTAFGAGLGVVFAAAALAGGAIDADSGADDAEPGAGHAMTEEQPATGGAHGAAQPVRGLAVDDGELTLKLDRTEAPAGARRELAFRITGRDGAVRKAFDLEHDRRMHVIVVRRDLSGFQHLHPRMDASGTWRVPLTLADPGSHRVFADFSADGEPHTLAADLSAPGTMRLRALPAPATVTTAEPGGLRVELAGGAAHAGEDAELAFTVSDAGRAITPEDYLGAKGHLVALREGDLAFLHVHPHADRLAFTAEFPSAGRYRLFLQFKAGDAVRTAAFTLEVHR